MHSIWTNESRRISQRNTCQVIESVGLYLMHCITNDGYSNDPQYLFDNFLQVSAKFFVFDGFFGFLFTKTDAGQQDNQTVNVRHAG